MGKIELSTADAIRLKGQALLPMRPAQVERRSHDCERHGTTSPFTALDIAASKVIGHCYQRPHLTIEFRKVLTAVLVLENRDRDI